MRERNDKHIYLTDKTKQDLEELKVRWGLSESATIAKALQLATEA